MHAQRARAKKKNREKSQEKRRTATPPPFIGVDGEGIAVPSGVRQPYVLLAASTGEFVEDYVGLGTHQCLMFLLKLQRDNPKHKLVVFSGVYDFTQMMADLPKADAQRLAETGECWWQSHANAGWYIRMLPRKFFGAAILPERPKTFAKVRAMFTLYDVWGFFQASFVKALDDWAVGSVAERAEIAMMKERRSVFAEGDKESVREYCLREVRLLVSMMDKLAESIRAVPSLPMIRSWHGAGAIADGILADRYAGDYLGEPLEDARVKLSYYGGRIESLRVGLVGGPLYEYDINSAYPYALSLLPDMTGEWRRKSEYAPRIEHAVWDVEWDVRKTECGRYFGPFPLRDKSGLWWPTTGKGSYLACEVRAALAVYGDSIKVGNGVVYEGPMGAPWAWIRDLYAQRQGLKRQDAIDGTLSNKPLKLGLNAMYGKTAQRPHWRAKDNEVVLVEGKWRQEYVASWQTALTRAALLTAASQEPDAILAFATDSVLSTRPLDVPESVFLGDWEREVFDENMMMIQPGFRLTESGRVTRVRGGLHSSLGFDAFRAEWERKGIRGVLESPDRRFIALRTAAGRSHVERRGYWTDGVRQIRFMPDRRRAGKREGGYQRLNPVAWPRGAHGPVTTIPVKPPSGREQLERWGELDMEAASG